MRGEVDTWGLSLSPIVLTLASPVATPDRDAASAPGS
jgi:hypothetical protein